ncbi:response regulator [Leptolyngbya sp. FACHB-541]|uniref:ATP-binding protein n=1 Tax=Leptolyngbya sp. FACHB-541 TaxID=2692810 RepID=UPI001683BE13|nr:ATP-binding protein [Leptolyngbya sp. FACHB-541]MBD1999489.1 response regulator [Leptolyngbya sp. FACHB-541]
MSEFLNSLFASNGFIPHGHCYLWKPELVGLHVGSDLSIGLAYFAISVTLVHLVRKIQLPFHGIFLAFGLFIAACGATHFIEVWTLWHPTYWLAGGVKLVTAIASVITALALPPLIPQVQRLVRSAKLAEERRLQLEMANQELATLYDQLKQMDQAKTQFFTNVSHELRTPLTLVLGPTERLLREEAAQPFRHSLENINRNARTLLKYVNDLLDISKLEANRMELRCVQLDLAQLLRLSASQFSTLAEERQVNFIVETPSALLVQGDAEKLQRVFLNLLANAFKFVPVGGEVRCTLQLQSHGSFAETWVDEVARQVSVTVQDSGPGVSPELRQIIFERYQQGDRQPNQHGGTGLGLAIAKEFVELHKGTIAVEDAPGGGASFIVTLPLADSDVGSNGENAANSANAIQVEIDEAIARQTLATLEVGNGHKTPDSFTHSPEESVRPLVLVVEDNPDMSQFICETLQQEYRIATAPNGQAGLEQAIALQPDLILTDLMMPQISGDQLVQTLRTYPELNSTPIILLSAKADDNLRIDLLRHGAQDYLMKPFSVDELRARVSNQVAVKQFRDVLEHELAVQSKDTLTLSESVASRQQELQAALIALRQSEARFRRVAESNMIGIMFWDLEGNITEANHTFLQTVGYTKEDLQAGRISWKNMTPAEFCDLDQKTVAELVRSGRFAPFEKEYFRKDGSRVPVLIGGAFLEESNQCGVSFVLDITERKRAEAALKQAHNELELRVEQRTAELSNAKAALVREQEFLKAVLDNVNAGIVACDSNGMLTLFNRATREFHGLPEQALAPEQWAEYYSLYSPDGQTPLTKEQIPLFRALQGEHVHNREMMIVPKQGSARTVLASGQAIADPQGTRLGAVVVMHDITQRKQAEAQIRALNAELEQRVVERTAQLEAANRAKDELLVREQAARADAEAANRMKDEFLATLSHELRTPLNAILGWAQLLRTRKFDLDTVNRALETIERNARSQTQLVGDILDVSRIIRGKVRLNIRSVTLISLIEAALDSVRPAAEAKMIDLEAFYDPRTQAISGDPERIQQVIWNLLSNAIKFTPQNGRVEVQLLQSNRTVSIRVSDTGRGINPKFLPHVFDRFRQADSSITRSHGGLGLGLAIVRHLVELHGGTVLAESEGEGQGATFTVTLPLVAPPEAAEAAELTSPTVLGQKTIHQPNQLAGLRILVVDDEADTRDFLTTLLEQCGATVIALESTRMAVDFLTAATDQTPDLLVSDIHMPEEDGYALIRQVRAIARDRNLILPAVALTACAGVEDRTQLLLAGFQIHIPKPVDAAEFMAVIANLTGRANSV